MCNKLETDRPHRKKSIVHKKPLLRALSEMQSSQQAFSHQISSGLGLGGIVDISLQYATNKQTLFFVT